MRQDQLEQLLQKLRIGLTQLLRERLDSVYLYGSQARGDAHPDSDIDILVVIQGNFDYFDMVEHTGQIASDLSLEFDTVISLAFTSKENYNHRMSPFLMNIRQEGIAV